MTPQEIQVLQRFLFQLTQAHVSAKDPDAAAMITRAVAQQPDADYLLVQRALLLAQALEQAKSQLARLKAQGDRVANSGSWNNAPPPTSGPGPAPVNTTQAQAAPQTAGANSGWSGFLGNAATTAAGVAGGAFLVQGLEGLFGHHAGGFLGEGGPTETVENVTVNDYSGDIESSRFASAGDSGRTDAWDDTESSGSVSADDSDGLDDSDFNDDSS